MKMLSFKFNINRTINEEFDFFEVGGKGFFITQNMSEKTKKNVSAIQ